MISFSRTGKKLNFLFHFKGWKDMELFINFIFKGWKVMEF